jgi:sentrin-specific protease 7
MQQSDVYDEVDELANGDYDYHPNKKVNSGLRQRPPVQSSSISRRGDMKPSLANVDKEAPLAKDPLPLKAFSWAPAHFYDSTDISTNDPESGPLTLMSRELDDGHKRAVLFISDAVHALEPSPKYAWFEVESWKLKTVKVNYDQCLVKLSGPNQLDNHLGAVLYLQFHSKDDTQRMILWVSRYTNEKPKPDPGGVLEKELHNKIAEIKKNEKRPTPMVTPAAKPQVDAEASQPTARLDSALPWRRMQQPRARLIDNMDSSPRVGSGPFGYPVREEELSVSELRPPRRSGRARRDVLSPGPVHLPDRWTEVHPDWDKDWRLPLSFHRTAVEKDDIARLDEGQCLNDNRSSAQRRPRGCISTTPSSIRS